MALRIKVVHVTISQLEASYSLGRRELRTGINYILLITDGYLDAAFIRKYFKIEWKNEGSKLETSHHEHITLHEGWTDLQAAEHKEAMFDVLEN